MSVRVIIVITSAAGIRRVPHDTLFLFPAAKRHVFLALVVRVARTAERERRDFLRDDDDASRSDEKPPRRYRRHRCEQLQQQPRRTERNHRLAFSKVKYF
jgi:hypothetical protein